MHTTASLANQLLIAMPNMRDPNFDHTVTLICQHNDDGALGIVLNRTVELTVGDILDQMDISQELFRQSGEPVHYGGPVQTERGFILHEDVGSWDSTLEVHDGLGLTTSRDILEAMARNEGPKRSLVALGYAGWGSGQLEQEISDNSWLNGPANPELIFSTPVEQRWAAAAQLLGVDLGLLSSEAGHA
jgi:putative transcriptional regulator